MDGSFADSLADWTAYYALTGGAGATLLGLQFVALSLRLNIFQRREVEDVRDFAILTFATFLIALALAGLALAPHESPRPLAIALALCGVAGLLAVTWVARVWLRLNREQGAVAPAGAPSPRFDVVYLLIKSGAYLAVLAAATLLWIQHTAALGAMAVAEAWLLGMGTLSSWRLMSHAGERQDN